MLKVLLAIGIAIGLVTGRELAAAPAKAICLVCQVMEGEAEEEPVKAVRTYNGKEYGFCSKKCAETFMADPTAFVPPVFPRPAPRFAITDLQGKPISNQTLKGDVVLLDFWATWCVPCRKSMPELQALHAKYSDRGFNVIGVSIDEGSPAKVKQFVQSKKIRYPIAIDSGKAPAWDVFRVKAVPAAFLIDREGQIVAQWTGKPADRQEVAQRVEELLRTER